MCAIGPNERDLDARPSRNEASRYVTVQKLEPSKHLLERFIFRTQLLRQ